MTEIDNIYAGDSDTYTEQLEDSRKLANYPLQHTELQGSCLRTSPRGKGALISYFSEVCTRSWIADMLINRLTYLRIMRLEPVGF